MGAELLFHADRQTDGKTYMTMLTVAFRSVINVPKMGEQDDKRERERERERNSAYYIRLLSILKLSSEYSNH
jgi:hypothetical protein